MSEIDKYQYIEDQYFNIIDDYKNMLDLIKAVLDYNYGINEIPMKVILEIIKLDTMKDDKVDIDKLKYKIVLMMHDMNIPRKIIK